MLFSFLEVGWDEESLVTLVQASIRYQTESRLNEGIHFQPLRVLAPTWSLVTW